MDEFGLRIEDGDDATGGFWPKAVVIYINGARLYDLSRAAASAPDEEWIAPPPGIVLPPSRQLLGGADVWEDPHESWFEGGRVAVGACGCSYPGCDALLVKIDIDGDVVTWHDFRRHNRPSANYDRLGPFRFDRGEIRSRPSTGCRACGSGLIPVRTRYSVPASPPVARAPSRAIGNTWLCSPEVN